jgi:hypothetical protein
MFCAMEILVKNKQEARHRFLIGIAGAHPFIDV